MAPTGPNKRHGASGHAARKTHRVRRSLAWLGSVPEIGSSCSTPGLATTRSARDGISSSLTQLVKRPGRRSGQS